MKKLSSILFISFCLTNMAFSQNIGINATGATPDASAMLDVSATNKGLLIPRVALTATNTAGPITSPTTSLLVYNTATAGTSPNNVVPGYYYWNGSGWSPIGSALSWSLTGNSGTNSSTNFIGTSDNVALSFRTNNTERMNLSATGGLGIGSSSFDGTNPEKLLVDAGTTTSYNLMTGKGSIDNYLQINVKNASSGGSASSDIVATSNNGSETTNYIDMGINSGSYTNTTYPVLGGANTAYLYSTGSDFVIGNSTASKPLRFFTGGVANANERMRIDGTGKVGIGNTSPTEVLDVTGNLKFSGALMPNNSAGTSGFVLSSNGTGAAPTWVNATSLVSSTSFWALDGSSVSSIKKIGTTSNFDLPVITNNTERMRVFTTGGVAIGSTSLDATNPEKLLVNAGTTTSFNAISGKGSINNYLQLNIQNTSTGNTASSDLVASANNATESVNFVDLGINSSGYSSTGVLGGANNAYLYSTGNDFIIGNAAASKPLRFFTGGTATTDEHMRIDGTGKVGIGTTSPTEVLDVTGNVKFSGALMPNNSAGTSGQILKSNGSGSAPTWVAPSTVLSGSYWAVGGNSVSSLSKIGTTSNFDLPFITNNTEKMRIMATGEVGIGSTDFDATNPEKLLIDAGTTTSTTLLNAVGTIDNYLQINVQNLSNGNNASTDIVATANNGTDNSVYVDLGINSQSYANGNSNILNGSNSAYLYANANDFLIGNGTPNKPLIFFTNPSGGTLGLSTANGVERMRITPGGSVGIGTSNPNSSYLLQVGGDAAKPGGGSWSSASDRRLKKDIRSFTDGLSVLNKINPVWFQYNGMGGQPDNGKSYVGIIAQEMKEIAPYTVGTFTDDATKTEYLNYDSTPVTYILINSVKEQQATIELLKKQLEDLQARIKVLEDGSK